MMIEKAEYIKSLNKLQEEYINASNRLRMINNTLKYVREEGKSYKILTLHYEGLKIDIQINNKKLIMKIYELVQDYAKNKYLEAKQKYEEI